MHLPSRRIAAAIFSFRNAKYKRLPAYNVRLKTGLSGSWEDFAKMNDDDNSPLEIDGSYKEGGGQILRNAITYAVLLNKSVTITNIRANRPRNPGVRPQHLTGMKLAVEIGSGGELVGAEVGAKTVSYVCHGSDGGATHGEDDHDNEHPKTFVADTGTAGSIALLLQAAFLPALVKSMRHHHPKNNTLTTMPNVKIELRGGTNATGAPQIDYITDVFAPFINSYFRHSILGIQIIKRGYYPKGGGVVHVNLHPLPSSAASLRPPVTFPPIRLTKCLPISKLVIKAFSAGNCPAWIAEKMATGAMKELKRALRENESFYNRIQGDQIIKDAAIEITHDKNCIGSGSGIMLVAYPNNKNCQTSLHYPALASSGLGDRKVPPLQTGSDAAKELIDCIASGGCVDRWLQDQIIPFMALAYGQSEILVGELTLHTQTAMKVAKDLTGCEFEVERLDNDVSGGDGVESERYGYGEGGESGMHLIRCQGIGFPYA